MKDGCYLIHIYGGYKQAHHYLGWSKNIAQRVVLHRKGCNRSVPLMRAVHEAGLKIELVRTWPGGNRRLERKLRDQHNNPRFCPVCRAWKEYTRVSDDTPF